MQQVGQADRVERREAAGRGAEHVDAIDLGPITRDPVGREGEAVGFEIQQPDPRRRRRETATVEVPAGPDADIEMGGAHVPVVEGEDPRGRAAPDQRVRQAQHDEVVQP